jgi:hypothetical protein
MTDKLINNFKSFNDMRPKWLDKNGGKLNLRRQIEVVFLGSAREGPKQTADLSVGCLKSLHKGVCKTLRRRATLKN